MDNLNGIFTNFSIINEKCRICNKMYMNTLNIKFCKDCSKIVTFHYVDCTCIYCRN